jgi:SAM-dependent methyltransferase
MTNHLGGAYAGGDVNTIMPDVWGYLLTKWPIRRMLDVGCGYGQAMKWFADVGGCEVIGIDGDPACVDSDDRIALHDFTAGLTLPSAEYDLAWSAEFLEHVDEKYLANLMSVFARAKLVVVTHGEPGQPGHHHVNCRPTSYWIDRFAEAGFDHLADETEILRATDRKRATYGRRTLTVFERRGATWNRARPPIADPGLVREMRAQGRSDLAAGARLLGSPYQAQLCDLIRAAKPYVVVETGVMSGISTHAILTAMDRNDRGILYSVEPDPCGGIMAITHPRWQQCKARSQDVLGPIFRQTGPWDAFLHDSDHEVGCQTFEYECAWWFVRPGGLIISDDTCWGKNGSSTAPEHKAWQTFCQRHELTEFAVGGARAVCKPEDSISCTPAYGEGAERDRAIDAVVARARTLAANAEAAYAARCD